MANVLNPETESITLNTELETPTLEPATELEPLPIDQPSHESTSNPETAAVVEALATGRRCPNRACSRGRARRPHAEADAPEWRREPRPRRP